eukprot:3878082-Amphidinium_carterae.1
MCDTCGCKSQVPSYKSPRLQHSSQERSDMVTHCMLLTLVPLPLDSRSDPFKFINSNAGITSGIEKTRLSLNSVLRH